MPKIAIVGSDISGLTCGLLLSIENDVHLFEAKDSLGGHIKNDELDLDDAWCYFFRAFSRT
jgi:predicted NAD/FAD-binding protein